MQLKLQANITKWLGKMPKKSTKIVRNRENFATENSNIVTSKKLFDTAINSFINSLI